MRGHVAGMAKSICTWLRITAASNSRGDAVLDLAGCPPLLATKSQPDRKGPAHRRWCRSRSAVCGGSNPKRHSSPEASDRQRGVAGRSILAGWAISMCSDPSFSTSVRLALDGSKRFPCRARVFAGGVMVGWAPRRFTGARPRARDVRAGSRPVRPSLLGCLRTRATMFRLWRGGERGSCVGCTLSRRRLTRGQEQRKVGVGNAPTFSDVDGAQRAGLDPLPDRSLGHVQPSGNFLHRLIAILRHRLPHTAVG